MLRFALLFVLIQAAPAWAFDLASFADARFSSDGRYFSFVEYGQLSGLDRAYASMYVIDTSRDAWASGTPLRIALDEIEATDLDALRKIRSKGAALVEKYKLTDPIEPALDREHGHPETPDRQSVSARLPALGSVHIELHQRPAKSAYHCTEDSEEPYDFSIVLSGSEKPVTLSDYAGELPKSRGCAQGYGLSNVYLHRSGGTTRIAALVGVYTLGWEGYDRRLLAVTASLP